MYLIPRNFQECQKKFKRKEWVRIGTHRLDKDHLLLKVSDTRIDLLLDGKGLRTHDLIASYVRITVFTAPRIALKYKLSYSTEEGNDPAPRSGKDASCGPVDGPDNDGPTGDSGRGDTETGSASHDSPAANS